MLSNLNRRLNLLEKIAREEIAKEENEIQTIWIDLFDTEVKEIVTESKRHQTHSKLNFPSTVIAGQYVENLLNDSGPKVGGWMFISDICEYFMSAYENADFARTFRFLLPDEVIRIHFGIPWNRGGNPVNFQSCILYAACRAYFSTVEFHMRYRDQQFTEHDHRYFNALFLIYQLIFPEGEDQEKLEEFCRLVIQAGRLNFCPGLHDN